MLNTHKPNSQNNIYGLIKMLGSTTSHDNLYFIVFWFIMPLWTNNNIILLYLLGVHIFMKMVLKLF